MYIYTHSSHKCLHDGKIYRHLETMCVLHINILDTHKCRIHAQEHRGHTQGMCQALGCKTLHFHAHTHLQTTVCPHALPRPRSASTLGSVLPVPGPTFSCPLPVPGHWAAPQAGEDLPRGLYSLFFVPLLFPSLAFWAGGAKGEMNDQLTERCRIPGINK